VFPLPVGGGPGSLRPLSNPATGREERSPAAEKGSRIRYSGLPSRAASPRNWPPSSNGSNGKTGPRAGRYFGSCATGPVIRQERGCRYRLPGCIASSNRAGLWERQPLALPRSDRGAGGLSICDGRRSSAAASTRGFVSPPLAVPHDSDPVVGCRIRYARTPSALCQRADRTVTNSGLLSGRYRRCWHGSRLRFLSRSGLRCLCGSSLCRLPGRGFVCGCLRPSSFSSLLRPTPLQGFLDGFSAFRTEPSFRLLRFGGGRFRFAPDLCPSALLRFPHPLSGGSRELGAFAR